MSFRIASFNIQKFGKMSVKQNKDGDTKKDLNTIANIIIENNFDIVAIQEIYHKEAMKELLEKISGQYAEKCGGVLLRGNYEMSTTPDISSRMNASYGYRTKHWEGRWAQPISYYGGNGIAEGYAFIWNRDRIKLVTNKLGETFEPRIADFGDSKKLARPPLIGRFMPINGSYEIRLINVHIVYAVPSKKIDEDEDMELEVTQTDTNDYELRKSEFDSLISTIYVDYSTQIFDKTRHDKLPQNLVPYTFMLGDYNLNLSSVKGQSSARLDQKREAFAIKLKSDMNIITVNDKLTSLKGKSRDPKKQELLRNDSTVSHHLANNYDHFSYDINVLKTHHIAQPIEGVVMAFNNYNDTDTETKYDIYRSKVSDHIPIYLEFDVRKRP